MNPDPQPPRGSFDGAVHRYALRVYYEDTDAGGVVYHANYIRWFERARSDLLDVLEIDQRAALDSGEGLYTVAEVQIRYLVPARLSDIVVIETHAVKVGRVQCTLRQIARRGETVLADGLVKVGFIGPDGRPRKQPEAWQAAFASILQNNLQTGTAGPEGQE